jgi:hypothetical protein
MTSTRRIFASDTDVRGTKNSTSATPMCSSASIANSNVHHSTSSSTLRTAGYHHQVTYTPQTTVSRPLSVHPQQICSPSYVSENLSLSNRQPTTTATNVNHNYTSSTSLNSTASGGTITTNQGSISTNSLGIKSIDPLLKGTYRVTFSDNSAMILRADCADGQMFVDTQGKRHFFDRRQPNQSEAIQERLALMHQDHPNDVEYSTSQQQQQ